MAPVLDWPVTLESADGRRMGLAGALGRGGVVVQSMLTRLLAPRRPLVDVDIATLAAATPLGPMSLSLELVSLSEGVERAAAVPHDWMRAVDAERSSPRSSLVASGRELQLEAALHVTMVLATEALAPTGIDDVDERIASGAQLWLLGAAVTWALLGAGNPFEPWAELVTAGLWPIGPSEQRLAVAMTARGA